MDAGAVAADLAALRGDLTRTLDRVSFLERNVEVAPPPPDASTTTKGLVKLATAVDARAGLDDLLAITPATLRAATLPVQGQIPSSVVVGSGSASVAADGVITFAGCSRVSLNDVFDGVGMGVYQVYASIVGTGAMALYTRLRKSGTDYTTANANYVSMYTYSVSGPSRSSSFGSNVYGYWSLSVGGAPIITSTATFHLTALVNSIRMLSSVAQSDRYVWDEYAQIPGETPDGFSIISSTSNTVSGSAKVVKIA